MREPQLCVNSYDRPLLFGKVIENRSDGTVVVRMNGAATRRGRWGVSSGYLVQGPAEDWSQANPSMIESNKVLSVSRDQAVLLSTDGHTQMTIRRQ